MRGTISFSTVAVLCALAGCSSPLGGGSGGSGGATSSGGSTETGGNGDLRDAKERGA